VQPFSELLFSETQNRVAAGRGPDVPHTSCAVIDRPLPALVPIDRNQHDRPSVQVAARLRCFPGRKEVCLRRARSPSTEIANESAAQQKCYEEQNTKRQILAKPFSTSSPPYHVDLPPPSQSLTITPSAYSTNVKISVSAQDIRSGGICAASNLKKARGG
jgi:hypothetical protein